MSILFLLLSISCAFADVMNLNENMPTRLEDATVTGLHRVDLQGSVRYDDDQERLVLTPNVRWGAVERIQIEYNTDYTTSVSHKDRDRADHKLGFQWNFNDQDDWVPSLAISPQLIFPTGRESNAADGSVKFIGTYTLLGTLADPVGQIHFNYRWTHNSDRTIEEYKVGKQSIIGYSHKLHIKHSLVTDFLSEQETFGIRTENSIEVGWLYEIFKDMVIGTGVAMDIKLGHFSSNLSGQFTF